MEGGSRRVPVGELEAERDVVCQGRRQAGLPGHRHDIPPRQDPQRHPRQQETPRFPGTLSEYFSSIKASLGMDYVFR